MIEDLLAKKRSEEITRFKEHRKITQCPVDSKLTNWSQSIACTKSRRLVQVVEKPQITEDTSLKPGRYAYLMEDPE